MTVNQVLSQDEVDALLHGIGGAADLPPDTHAADADPKADRGPRDYSLASQERIVRGRMPTMEIVMERFARNIRLGLFNFLRKSPEVSLGGVKVMKYSAFLREIAVPTNFNIVTSSRCAATAWSSASRRSSSP
jgi:flagellar motor switch protein FliM